jgi:hypothetical protein
MPRRGRQCTARRTDTEWGTRTESFMGHRDTETQRVFRKDRVLRARWPRHRCHFLSVESSSLSLWLLL